MNKGVVMKFIYSLGKSCCGSHLILVYVMHNNQYNSLLYIVVFFFPSY